MEQVKEGEIKGDTSPPFQEGSNVLVVVEDNSRGVEDMVYSEPEERYDNTHEE